MATQLTVYATGKLGNIVMYRLGDKHVVRSRPAVVRKTAKMKTCSSNFGIAARAGKYCRMGLLPLLPDAKDSNMQCRFSGVINSWMGKQALPEIPADNNIAALQQFNFNEHSSFYERFKKRVDISISATNSLQVNIPAFDPAMDISAPAHTAEVEIKIAVAAHALGTNSLAAEQHYYNRFNYTNPQAAHSLHVDVPAGDFMLIMVAASLTYYFADGKMETRQAFTPASVLRAIYLG